MNKNRTAKALAYKYLHGLRGDLEKVRMLADFARKREREKTRSANIISTLVDSTIFPHDGILQSIFEQIVASVFPYKLFMIVAELDGIYIGWIAIITLRVLSRQIRLPTITTSLRSRCIGKRSSRNLINVNTPTSRNSR